MKLTSMKSINNSEDHTLPQLLGVVSIPSQTMSNPPIVAFPPELGAGSYRGSPV